jgi:hypothetical protein
MRIPYTKSGNTAVAGTAPYMNLPMLTPTLRCRRESLAATAAAQQPHDDRRNHARCETTPRQTCAVGTAATSPRRRDTHENRSSRRPNPERSQRQPPVYPDRHCDAMWPATPVEDGQCCLLHRGSTGMIATHTPGAPRAGLRAESRPGRPPRRALLQPDAPRFGRTIRWLAVPA